MSFPPGFFRRQDERDDGLFYGPPRLVTHIDDATIAALTAYYREALDPASRVLDLMSSWVSHLPGDVAYARVEGSGMNRAELLANPRLQAVSVHDLNRDPELPYADDSFDEVLIAVSIQYLTRPLEVFRSIARVLAPGGHTRVAVSHRMFPTKAILGWQLLPPAQRPLVVELYLKEAGGFEQIAIEDRSPAGFDPLWVVSGRAASR